MTGEMVMPPKAEKGESYWKDKNSGWGRVIGDEMFLIRPNYPEMFGLWDKLKKIKGVKADIHPHDIYRGGCIFVSGRKQIFKVWGSEIDNLWTIEQKGKFYENFGDDGVIVELAKGKITL